MQTTHPILFRPTRSTAGMTLVEVVTTLAVVAVMTAAVLPSVQSSSKPYRVVEESRRIHSMLQKARARAVAEQMEYQFELNSDGTYELQKRDPTLADPQWTVDGLVQTVADAVTVEGDQQAATTITFYPSGRVDAPATITVEDDERTHEIEILASGMARWKSGVKAVAQ